MRPTKPPAFLSSSSSTSTVAAVKNPVFVRSVWSHNLESEFKLIRTIIDDYPYISLDTEFPGAVDTAKFPTPPETYRVLKSNVDLLKLIQVGLTLSDIKGNLPTLAALNQYSSIKNSGVLVPFSGNDQESYIWEFNFREFNPDVDPQVKASVEMLKNSLIDFKKNNEEGVDANEFSQILMTSGLVLNESVSWITYHGSSDFAYLLKNLTGAKLPDTLDAFLELVRVFFGDKVYDVKHLNKFSRFRRTNGLNKLANEFRVARVVGNQHQSGSDSLLTWRLFLEIKHLCSDKNVNVLHGLEPF